MKILLLTSMVYLLSVACIAISLKTPWTFMLKMGRWILFIGILFHFEYLFSIFFNQQRFFPTNVYQSHLSISALLAMVAFIMSCRKTGPFILLILLPFVILGLLVLAFYPHAETPVTLPSFWLWTHIVLMIFGEVLFAIAAAASIVYLLADYRLRKRQVSYIFAQIPSLPALDSFVGSLLGPGVLFLSSGMLMGFFFAKRYWADPWYLDPKVIFCVLTWLFYLFLIVMRRHSRSFEGRKSAQFAVIGFLAVLFLAWGVQKIFPSQHIGDPTHQSESP